MPHLTLFLLAFFIIYFALAFVWQSWRNYRRTGINPVVLPTTDDAYGYVARGFKVVMLVLTIYLTLINVSHTVLQFGLFKQWQSVSLEFAGCGLMVIALLVTLKAQVDMGVAWRIGIDTQRKTPLASTGLFAVSRNPIYLSMRLAMLGLFLALPGAVSLTLLCLAEVLMQVQVRLEEAHLQAMHGMDYQQYCQQVRRWL